MRHSLILAAIAAVCLVQTVSAQTGRPPVGGTGAAGAGGGFPAAGPVGGAAGGIPGGGPAGGGVAPAAAARPSVTTSGHPVVVMDLSYVFKKLSRFQAAQEALKQEATAYEGSLKQSQEKIRSMQSQISGDKAEFKPGTQGYKSMEEQITKAVSEVQVNMSMKKKDLMEREAKLYFNTYEEVSETVARFAEVNGIQIVIRYSADKIDKDNANSVLQGVNRPIIYSQPGLDISETIIKIINDRTGPIARPDPRNSIPR